MNVSKQDAVLAKVAKIGSCCVTDFCKPLDVKSVENVENVQQNITAFGLSQEVDQMLEPLHAAIRSTTFTKLWYQQGHEEGSSCSSLDDVVEKVWKPVNQR